MSFINGKIIHDHHEFKKIFKQKSFIFNEVLSHEILFHSLNLIREKLIAQKDFYQILRLELEKRNDTSSEEAKANLQGLIDFISIDELRKKIQREFKTLHPFELKRVSFKEDYFEAYYPRGVICHMTPNNSPLLSVLGMIEGLISGSINIIKLGRSENHFAEIFFQELIQCDPSQTLKNYIIISKFSSIEKDFLKEFLSVADVVSAWGNEESISSIKDLAPKHAKIVEWGHKISFAYITSELKNDQDVFEKLAFEICNNEQLACSSPQTVFLENASFDELLVFANRLQNTLKKISPTIHKTWPDDQTWAEITIVKEQVRIERPLKKTKIFEAQDLSYRLLIDDKEGLSASPLYRTLWVRSMKRERITEILRPFAPYLQTAGLATPPHQLESLLKLFYAAGVLRVTPLGEMTNAYTGEPHDGVSALLEFTKKISLTNIGQTDLSLIPLSNETKNIKSNHPIMTKSDFQLASESGIADRYCDLFFHSGGSTGGPKLSIFTYEDYHRQMEMAAHGLFAAGLDPKIDRVMNLFYGGQLYGGMISFFTILEYLEAKHFPMGAPPQFNLVSSTIIKNNVSTLLGMPSYIMQLFSDQKEVLKKYRGIKKIFFGGEHMSLAQRNYLQHEFGVETIRSASYGSVDAGPLGFQCEYCEGSIHHLHEALHCLEIVELESDVAVNDNQVGRLLFTSKSRRGQDITRYEIGDIGRKLSEKCACGRSAPLFELLGRHGDVFRIGTMYLSYQKFQKILIDEFVFEGLMQIHLLPMKKEGKETLSILIEKTRQIASFTSPNLTYMFLKKYPALAEAVLADLVLNLVVHIVEKSEITFNPVTGKLKSVIDHR